ncbi:MAG: sn-glycerol-3-phosphate ABC transporter ATP-binding protein UgpC [Hyphomicrobiales bacterium]
MADIEIKGLDKQFGKVSVIKNVDLSIKDKEFVVFVGPSGCGKSTLLRLISGLEELSGGEIHIDGERIDQLPPSKRGISMVFQSYALYPHMTVKQNMSYSLKVAKLSKSVIDEKVGHAANILQLTELLNRKPKELSGGQRQRVAIGRAIVRNPKLFLFDEPLSNLDAKLRVQMRLELTKLHRDLNATMIYVTHDQVEAMTMADKIVVIKDGVIEQVGAPLDLYNNPKNIFVAGFIGSPAMNFLEGNIVEKAENLLKIKLKNGKLVNFPCKNVDQVNSGDKVNLGVRPEILHITDDPENQIQGEVFAVERLGNETYIYMRNEINEEIVLHSAGDKSVNVGQAISAGFNVQDSHLFGSNGAVVL